MPDASPQARRRPAWLTTSLLAAAVAAGASGLAQFSVTALVGDVADTFGAPGAGEEIADRIGLTGTTLGVSLALIRLASLPALPLTALADGHGRRTVLLRMLAVGLVVSALAALAPGYWVWVVVVALARPWLSAANGLAGVIAAEEADSVGRSWAIAVIAAAYGLGAGIVPIVRGIAPDASFRVVLALALVPLLALPWLSRRVREPVVYEHAAVRAGPRLRDRLPGAVDAVHVPRLVLLLLSASGISLATGPGFTYVVVYAEEILGMTEGTTALVVLSAGPAGGAGLLLGRWAADRVGRRPAAGMAMTGTALGLVVAYSGSEGRLVAGYLLGIAAAGAFGPPAGALAAEAFPTSVRATVAGWVGAAGVGFAVLGLALFGILADATGGFETSARVLAVLVLLASVSLVGLPETRGRELDEPAPGPASDPL